MEKYYEFHWLDGQVLYSKGESEEDAARKIGIGLGALSAIDYIKESKELPLDNKEIIYIPLYKKKETLNRNTLFVEKVMEHIKNQENDFEIRIGKYTWKCTSEIKPFEIVLTQYI